MDVMGNVASFLILQQMGQYVNNSTKEKEKIFAELVIFL